MKNVFIAVQFGDNWSDVVKQLKEKFSSVLESSDVVVVTGSPFLYKWSLSNCTFETNWVDSEGNEYVCCFDIDASLSSITIEGCEWVFEWKNHPSEKVEIYKLNPIELDFFDIDI
jgi:predicted phosphohydrolase